MEERGRALAAAALRRDALIAPSGCGQCPGEEQQHGASGAGLTLPDVITGPRCCYISHGGGERTRGGTQMCPVERKRSVFLLRRIPAVPLLRHPGGH